MDPSATSEATPSAPPRRTRAQDLLQVWRGETFDYTAIPLDRAVLLLAVPMVLEMCMESLFAIVDVFWVSRLGHAAVAVIGLTESLMTLVYAVAIGISIAATAIVARRIGERDPQRAAQAAGQVLVLGVAVSAALGLLLGGWAPEVLRLMGAEPQIVALGSDYARLMLGGNLTVFLIFVINAIFRGAGDAVIAMRALLLANALNIVLDPCFIFGWGPFPALGLTGAGVATNLGRAVGVAYQLWHLLGRDARVTLRASNLLPRRNDLRAITATAWTGVLQLLIGTTSWVGLFKLLAAFGSTSLAAYTIAIRVVMFALMPAWGLANAGATLVGQNLGAGAPARAARAVAIATRFNMLFLGIVGLGFVLGAQPIVAVFTDDPAVLAEGALALRIVSVAFPLYAAGMCLEGAFNGAGDTWTPTRLNFYAFWVCQVPLAWLLAVPLEYGPPGIYTAVPVSFTGFALWAFLLYRQGHWKSVRV